MAKYDVTKLNVAIDRLLAETHDPRHRFLLQAYSRHRYLEVAGRYEELFAPEMMAPAPTYHFRAGRINATLAGRDAVKSLYRMWAETNQCIFSVENEHIAVADNFVASTCDFRQQLTGLTLAFNTALSQLPSGLASRILRRVLATMRFKADPTAMYTYASFVEMVWRYDDRGRLLGEDVLEPDPERATITKLDPADVLTTEESARLLAPLIEPLPPYDEAVRGYALA